MLRPATDLPHGFRPASGSGLLVPEELSREREVFTRDEGRLLDRAIALLQSHKVSLMLKCGKPGCTGQSLERIKGLGSDYTLRCGCTDRVFTRAF